MVNSFIYHLTSSHLIYCLLTLSYWITLMFGYDTETYTGLSAHAQFNEN